MSREGRRAKLGDVCTKITDGSHNPPKGLDHSPFMMLSSKNIDFDSISYTSPRFLSETDFNEEDRRTEVQSDDVLLTIVGTIGRVAVVPNNAPRFTLQRSVAVLKPDQSVMTSRFLMYALWQMTDALNASSRGVAQKGIYLKALREIDLPVPPLPEQQRIVGILDQAFEGIAKAKANAERNLANAKELYLKKLELEFSERADWEVSPLKALTTKIGSGATPKGGRESYVSEGIPLVRSMNVYDDGFKNDELAFLSNAQAEKLNGVTLWDGDVLLNITGASVARCCVAPSHVIGGRVNQHVSIIRPSTDRLLSEFLHLNLTAPPQKKRLLGVGEQGGSTRQAITKSEIEAFVLHYPQELNEQRKIADCLHEFKMITDKQMETERRRIACLAELKSSILHQAFSGNL